MAHVGIICSVFKPIIIGGGAGTLSEIAMAWQKYNLIIALTCVDGWGKRLAGQKKIIASDIMVLMKIVSILQIVLNKL